MAFCTKCGKPLQDGEVCLCQSAVQPQVTPVTPAQVAPVQETVIYQPAQPNAFQVFLKGLWAIVIGVLKSPVTTINTYVQKADAKVACTLIGINALVVALIKWFIILKDINRIYGKTSVVATKYSAGNIFKQLCQSALLTIAIAAVIALVIMVAVNTFGKAKATYAQGIAIVSLTAILVIPAVIISYIFGLFEVVFFSQLGNWITVFAEAVGAIYLFLGVRVVCKDENKIPFIAGLCAASASIAVYLIGLMF